MAKKKSSKAKVEEEENDDELEDSLFSSDDETPSEETSSEVTEPAVDENVATLDYPEVPETPEKDYKYLKGYMIEAKGNVYRVEFKGASHGFLSYLAGKLLETKGVEYAAYKLTSLDDPVLTVMTDGKADLKKVLKAATKQMKKEIEDLKKCVKTSI